MTDQEYLLQILKGLVLKSEEVSVIRRVDEMGVLLTVSVAKEDMGKIIGREGSTANAVRHLMRVFGMMSNARVNVKILEPEGSTYQSNRQNDKDLIL